MASRSCSNIEHSSQSQPALQPFQGWGHAHNSQCPRLFVHAFEQAQIPAEILRLAQKRFPLPRFPKRRVFDHQRASLSPSFSRCLGASIAPGMRHAASHSQVPSVVTLRLLCATMCSADLRTVGRNYTSKRIACYLRLSHHNAAPVMRSQESEGLIRFFVSEVIPT